MNQGGLVARPLGHAHLWLAAAVMAAVFMLLVPLPTRVVDILLALQLAVALTVVLGSIDSFTRATEPGASHLALFPALLLGTTFVRLALNVSTTRLILSRGDAGEVIDSFAGIAVAGSLLVGVVLFVMVTLVQLMVVARGSERIAEVAARFSLDAMPGEQLAIDAEVRAGTLDAQAAAEKRALLRQRSRVVGAMDGALRFVRGDAMVALAIVAINLVGGLLVGVAVNGMNPADAAARYLMLSIGDGLATQIPALLITLAAALAMVRPHSEPDERTRGSQDGRPGVNEARSIGLMRARVLVPVAALFLVLASLPGVPGVPFASVGLAALLLALWQWRQAARTSARNAGSEPSARVTTPVAAVELSVGRAVARTLGATRADDPVLTRALQACRTRLGTRMGVPLPGFTARIDDRDPVALELRMNGVCVARASEAECEPLTFVAEQIPLTIERYAFELIDVDSVADALASTARDRPALVREVVPGIIDRVRLTTLVRQLVRERIPVPTLATVLRALSEVTPDGSRGIEFADLTERVRRGLAAAISATYAPHGRVRVWRLDPFVEDTLRGAIERDASGSYLVLEPEIAHDIADTIARATAPGDEGAATETPILLASSDVRRFVARLVEVEAPRVLVLSPGELAPEIRVETTAVIEP